MGVFNWLVQFFGGFTKEEFVSLEKEYNSQRDLVNSYRAREEQIISQLNEEKEERKRLQEIIFKKFNVLPEENSEISSQEIFQPINTGKRRWSDLKSRLEQDDLQRVQSLVSGFKEFKQEKAP